MPKLNLRGGSVLYSGAVTALLQYFVESNHVNSGAVTTGITALLTILVAVHGALTNSIFEKNKTAQAADVIVSEGESFVGDVQNQLGEK